ncbi:MAG: hypothetical protein LBM74_06565 [Oscillospiraceae bacterium]|jgi:hypothetical protein|nr:hypothetical protein [Oscillospiraceae bacterium]
MNESRNGQGCESAEKQALFSDKQVPKDGVKPFKGQGLIWPTLGMPFKTNQPTHFHPNAI